MLEKSNDFRFLFKETSFLRPAAADRNSWSPPLGPILGYFGPYRSKIGPNDQTHKKRPKKPNKTTFPHHLRPWIRIFHKILNFFFFRGSKKVNFCQNWPFLTLYDKNFKILWKFLTQGFKPCGKVTLFASLGLFLCVWSLGPNLDLLGPKYPK